MRPQTWLYCIKFFALLPWLVLIETVSLICMTIFQYVATCASDRSITGSKILNFPGLAACAATIIIFSIHVIVNCSQKYIMMTITRKSNCSPGMQKAYGAWCTCAVCDRAKNTWAEVQSVSEGQGDLQKILECSRIDCNQWDIASRDARQEQNISRLHALNLNRMQISKKKVVQLQHSLVSIKKKIEIRCAFLCF